MEKREKWEKFQKKDFLVFNCQFFQRLIRGEESLLSTALRIPKNISVFDKKKVFIPINDQKHWILFVIFNLPSLFKKEVKEEEKLNIMYCDSLESDLKKIKEFYSLILRYLRLRLIHEKKIVHEMTSKHVPLTLAVLPKQNNSWDCGVYVIIYIELLIFMKIESYPVVCSNLFGKDLVLKMRKKLREMIETGLIKSGELIVVGD